jgi:hypothetical protein
LRTELRIARASWPAVAGLLLGLAVGGVWTLLQPDRYRAEARVVVQGNNVSTVLPAVKALGESSILEQNVAQTQRLAHPPHVSATAGAGSLVKLTVEAGDPERARQIDAEAAQVLTQLVQRRFGTDPGVTATVLDPAHPVEQTSPTGARNLLIAGLAGLVLGAGAAVASSRRRAVPSGPTSVDPEQERRLSMRIDAVAKRERALAKRAGELAARERAADELASGLAARERALAEAVVQRAAEAAAAKPEPEPEPAPKPEPEPEPEQEPSVRTQVPSSAWTIEGLEHIAREQRAAFPALAAEWDTYLYLLREHATIEGALPRSFDPLIAEVFGAALDRYPGDSTD